MGSETDPLVSSKPSIQFAQVCCDGHVVVENYVKAQQTNLPAVMQRIIPKLYTHPGEKNGKPRLIDMDPGRSDGYYLVCQMEGTMLYLCVIDKKFRITVACAFLDAISMRFKASFGTENAFKAYDSGCKDFEAELKSQGDIFTDDPPISNKEKMVLEQMDSVKELMVENIEAVIERHEKIDILVEQTEDLRTVSNEFQEGARKVKRKMWWRDKKWCLMIICLMIIILAILLLVLCKPDFGKCGNDKKK